MNVRLADRTISNIFLASKPNLFMIFLIDSIAFVKCVANGTKNVCDIKNKAKVTKRI